MDVLLGQLVAWGLRLQPIPGFPRVREIPGLEHMPKISFCDPGFRRHPAVCRDLINAELEPIEIIEDDFSLIGRTQNSSQVGQSVTRLLQIDIEMGECEPCLVAIRGKFGRTKKTVFAFFGLPGLQVRTSEVGPSPGGGGIRLEQTLKHILARS